MSCKSLQQEDLLVITLIFSFPLIQVGALGGPLQIVNIGTSQERHG